MDTYYNKETAMINENDTATLGLVGTLECMFLLVSFYSTPLSNLFDSLSVPNLTALLFFTMGGLGGAIFSFVLWSQIRGYNRLSVYIGFFSILAFLVMLGRPADIWIRHVSDEPADQMIPALMTAGFAGIWIDRYGYPDHGAAIEAELQEAIGRPPLVSDNERRSFFLWLGNTRRRPRCPPDNRLRLLPMGLK